MALDIYIFGSLYSCRGDFLRTCSSYIMDIVKLSDSNRVSRTQFALYASKNIRLVPFSYILQNGMLIIKGT